MKRFLSYFGKIMAGAALCSCLLAPAGAAESAEPTAFELVKEGNKYVGVDAKDKVVQIRSDRSVVGLQPRVWYIVYYDPDATFKATEVKFGAGKKLSVKRPWRLLEPITGNDKKLDSSKLKVDSDKALEIAGQEPLLDKLTLKHSQFWLEHGDEGPVWKIRLWVGRAEHPGESVEIGEVFVAADTGKVTKTDVHLDRLD